MNWRVKKKASNEKIKGREPNEMKMRAVMAHTHKHRERILTFAFV